MSLISTTPRSKRGNKSYSLTLKKENPPISLPRKEHFLGQLTVIAAPMTRSVLFLDATTTSAVSTTADSSSSSYSPPLNSDLVVILAALLCALVCILGLIAVARCAWIRCLSTSSSSSTSSALPMHSAYSTKAANKGVKKKTLRSLPKLTFSSPDSSSNGKFSDCNICLMSFADGDELRVLPQCGHTFHVPCIDTWLGSHSSCPSCRRILVTSSLLDLGNIDTDSWCEGCCNLQVTSIASTSMSSNSGDGGTEEGGAKRTEEADAADADARE